ncbi:SubName: Full=Uncharacterized protein {ECO:0000313/EMBL:CCA73797.1} [Serendipita indica DSM 11827]|nr:SubName: Full=Uncharacterized protein {ECO:0000313/EMBL:CCA73797.1} [Serendipita indica DSM 11827]
MSKHPAGYYAAQPPIPPGHPPPAPAQHYDAYSTWSVAAAAAQQQYYQASAAAAASAGPGSPPVNPYANYGYGPAATWAHHPPPPAHRAPPPPTPVPPPAQPYGPYIPQAQPQPYSPHNPSTPYAPRQLPPPITPSQPLPAAPRPFQQPPLKRQRVHSLQSNGSRFPPIPAGPARPPTDAPPPLPGLPLPVTGPNLRSGNAVSSRGRGHPLRPSRGGRGGGAPNRHGSGASRQSANTIPRGPRRGGLFPQASSRSFRSSSGGDGAQSSRGWSHGVSESGTSVFNSSTGASMSDKEGKRTLTDFRIIGFGFVSDQLTWSWGATRPIDDKVVFPPSSTAKEDPKPTAVENPSPVKQDDIAPSQGSPSKDKGKKTTKDTARIRIYFQPTYFPTRGGRMPPPSSVPSRPNAKRKKSDSEEDDGERGNIKRHHGENEEGSRNGILAEIPLPTSNGDKNVEKDSTEAVTDEATHAQEEQNTDASSEAAAWMGQALKDLKEDSDDGHEHDLREDDDDQNSEANDLTTELVEGYDDEEEEGTSLFGSGVHPSPGAEDASVDLIVQSVEDVSNHGDGVERGEEPSTESQNPNNANGSFSQAGQSSGAGGPGGSSNKLSVSFASSSRRLVLEAEVITYLKVFRAEGRIEFASTLETDPLNVGAEGSDPVIKGVFLEVWNEEAQAFHTVPVPSTSAADSDLPPLRGSKNVTFHVFLDMENPLSMPRWVKTGDVDDWLLTMLGSSKHMNTYRREMSTSVRGWEGKISVVDPDPALTLQNTLEHWATNSVVAQQKDREQYLKSFFYHPDTAEEKRKPNMDSMMELLLRPIRGGQPTIGSHLDSHHHHHHNFSYNNSVNPILQAAANSDPTLISGQTHTSLAVLALFRVLQQTATKYGGDEALKEAEARVRDIIQALPSQMTNKNLDAMFQRWNHSNGGASKGSASNGKSHR